MARITFKLLIDLKKNAAFEKTKEYLNNDGVAFGGIAGAIIFGKGLEACRLDDVNGVSILCHYTNRAIEKG